MTPGYRLVYCSTCDARFPTLARAPKRWCCLRCACAVTWQELQRRAVYRRARTP